MNANLFSHNIQYMKKWQMQTEACRESLEHVLSNEPTTKIAMAYASDFYF